MAPELASLLARAGVTGTTAIVRMGTMAMAIGPIMGIVGMVTTAMVTAVTGHAMHIAAGTNWVATWFQSPLYGRGSHCVSEVKSMWTVLLSTTAIAAVIGMGMAPAKAASLSTLAAGNTNIQVAPAENVGYRRRFYRRYGYPVPYAYYPPAYGYYAPPSAYVYPPPPVGAYADAPPPEGDYADAPAPDGDYVDAPAPDGDYADAPPAGADYADSPPPEGY